MVRGFFCFRSTLMTGMVGRLACGINFNVNVFVSSLLWSRGRFAATTTTWTIHKLISNPN
jgi:hypothetical protein